MGFVTNAIDSALDTVNGLAKNALSMISPEQALGVLSKAVEMFKPDADTYQESGSSPEERRKKLRDDVREKVPEFVDYLREQDIDVEGFESTSDYDSDRELRALRDVFEEVSEEESVPDDVRAEAKKIVESFDDALDGSTAQRSEQ